jgi:hypothetical protein
VRYECHHTSLESADVVGRSSVLFGCWDLNRRFFLFSLLECVSVAELDIEKG